MNSIRLNRLQWNIRHAIQRVHQRYHKSPHSLLTEADIQCLLYAELLKYASKKGRTMASDINGKKIRDWDYQVITMPLHAELSSKNRKKAEFVDLCILDPSEIDFWIQKTKFSRSNKDFPIWQFEWYPEKSIGIEIKFNWWLSQKKSAGKLTKNWDYLKKILYKDLKKLKRYKRGWLIFVDNYALINNKEEWRELVDELIRHSNYGSAKKTLNAFYLSPKLNKALCYRPYWFSY